MTCYLNDLLFDSTAIGMAWLLYRLPFKLLNRLPFELLNGLPFE
jgi:hypothetical protein